MKTQLISNRTLILRILATLLIVSIIATVIATIYIKQTALHNLAEDDAHKTSELIFETMNARMQQGWGKEDLAKILNRMETIREGLIVKSFRSKNVEEILGVHEEDKKIVQNDPLIQKAMKGEKQFVINEDGSVRYIYPIKVSQECISCHYNTKVGDVNGVLDIQYPPNEIKISLDMVVYYFLIFFIFFIFIYFLVFYKVISNKLIKPIVNFTEDIKEVTKIKNFKNRVNEDSNTIEIHTLQITFNKLLDKITYYYNQLLNNLYTDSLTKLPNLVKLQEDIKKEDEVSLAIIALDSFKTINNFYGLKVGDFILKQIAENLKEFTNTETKVYRLYSDEFAILSTNITKEMCEDLIVHIKTHNFAYEDNIINIQATIGFVNKTHKRALEKTTMAVREAKKEKKDICQFHNELIQKDIYKKHIEITKLIKESLKNKSITTFYQALEDNRTGEICKYESLVRIKQNKKVLKPLEFLEIAKNSKQYDKVTQAVIKNSFEYFSNKKDLQFSINFCMEDMKNPKTINYLISMIKKYNIGERLTIELLETEEFTDFELINSFIKKVKELNVQIAIDDFGSGYSNFAYIVKLPIDYLKMDSSLIENIDKDKQALKIVKSIISFANELGIKTVAEKVHNKEIYDMLKELPIDYLQGYYIGKPKEEV